MSEKKRSTGNVFQRMAREIEILKKEKATLEDSLKNFDEETRKKFDISANELVLHLETENSSLREKVKLQDAEIATMRKRVADLQDLNEELLTSITSKNGSSNYL